MSDTLMSEIDIDQLVQAIEQKFATGATGNGIAPELAGSPFAPYAATEDGVIRYKKDDNPAVDEADDGGLFTLAHKQPGVLEWVMMDLSSLEDWAVKIVTSAGEWEVGSGTGERYVILSPRAPIMPGENVKVTFTTATGKPWVRIYVRSDQSRH
jgi:hypothetical protein